MLGEVLTATVTPFDADGGVDYERYADLCRFLVENGSDGVVVSGTTGESPTLSDDERLELLPTARPTRRELVVDAASLPCLEDHLVRGTPTLPGAWALDPAPPKTAIPCIRTRQSSGTRMRSPPNTSQTSRRAPAGFAGSSPPTRTWTIHRHAPRSRPPPARS